MEEEDDDFYGNNGNAQADKEANAGDSGSEQMDEDSDRDEAGMEESDDESIEFNLDNEAVVEKVEEEASRRQAGKLPPDHRQRQAQGPPETRSTLQAASSQEPKATGASSTRPAAKVASLPTVAAPVAASNSISGSSYPPIRSSSIDFSEATLNPPFPPVSNKPIRDVDLDADITDKSWRVPGVDQSEFFNYGFDEFTWATYVLRQKELRGFADTTTQQMKDQFGMMGLPVPGGMPGAHNTPQQNGQGGQQPGQQGGGSHVPVGMPDEQQMQQMMQQMMSSGMDPSQINFDDFMRFSGMPVPGMPGMTGTGAQAQQGQAQQQWGQGSQNFGGGQGAQGNRGNRGGRRW